MSPYQIESRDDLLALLRAFLDKSCIATMATKGRDYESRNDPFAGLKANAERNFLEPERVLMVLLTKHLDAITTWIERGELASEQIDERICDAINHLLLMYGWLVTKGDIKEHPWVDECYKTQLAPDEDDIGDPDLEQLRQQVVDLQQMLDRRDRKLGRQADELKALRVWKDRYGSLDLLEPVEPPEAARGKVLRLLREAQPLITQLTSEHWEESNAAGALRKALGHLEDLERKLQDPDFEQKQLEKAREKHRRMTGGRVKSSEPNEANKPRKNSGIDGEAHYYGTHCPACDHTLERQEGENYFYYCKSRYSETEDEVYRSSICLTRAPRSEDDEQATSSDDS